MNNFLIKNSLLKLKEKNYDLNINNTIDKLIQNLDESQLKYILSNQGIKFDNNTIKLYFIDNVGFRCMNENFNIVGKMPICNNIEKFLNKLYLEYIENSLENY